MSKVSNWLIGMAEKVIWTEVNWTEVHPYPRIRPLKWVYIIGGAYQVQAHTSLHIGS